MGANPASRHDPRSCFLSLRLGPLSSMLSYAALCRRSGAKSLGQTLIVLNLAKASHSREIAALRDFDPADVRFGLFTTDTAETTRSCISALPQKADKVAGGSLGLLCAKTGLMQRNKDDHSIAQSAFYRLDDLWLGRRSWAISLLVNRLN